MTTSTSSGGTITIGSKTFATTSSTLRLYPMEYLAYGQIRRPIGVQRRYLFLVLGAVPPRSVWQVITFIDGRYAGILTHSTEFLIGHTEIVERLA